MTQRITIESWLQEHSGLMVVDVRSPVEFCKGHIPGALNIPLFSDEERAAVSIAYNQVSEEKAIELGLRFAEPKLESFVKRSLEVAPGREVVVHCWRGGMRSEAFAKHLEEHDFHKVCILENGYKGYRNYVQGFFAQPFNLKVLGGFTGSGKTETLRCLSEKGEQVVDLEGLAHHRGSAFGSIGMPPQPTTEQFENDVFTAMLALDSSGPVWLEDESMAIGRVNIPSALFARMNSSTLCFLKIPQHERARYLVEMYAGCKKEELVGAIEKITKRLGLEKERLAMQELARGNLFQVAKIMLSYYDKYYLKGMLKREKSTIVEMELNEVNPAENADLLLRLLKMNDL